LNIFYTTDIITEERYVLNEEESWHISGVLRLAPGEIIYLVDGKGGFNKAEILECLSKKCTVRILEKKTEYGKSPFTLRIALAPTKSMDRTEWFIEKATEIGINEIIFVGCSRSERKIIKLERLQKILISAMKQSQKAYLPGITDLINFNEFIKKPFDGQKFIAHCNIEKIRTHLKMSYTSGQNALILIGPEGDFSMEEIDLATQNGFVEITLGNSRLRTETAALVACNIIHLLN